MADAIVRTLRDLSRDTGKILEEITRTGQPAFITSHGRFVAVLAPLKPGEIESRVLSDMAREIGATVGRGKGES